MSFLQLWMAMWYGSDQWDLSSSLLGISGKVWLSLYGHCPFLLFFRSPYLEHGCEAGAGAAMLWPWGNRKADSHILRVVKQEYADCECPWCLGSLAKPGTPLPLSLPHRPPCPAHAHVVKLWLSCTWTGIKKLLLAQECKVSSKGWLCVWELPLRISWLHFKWGSPSWIGKN